MCWKKIELNFATVPKDIVIEKFSRRWTQFFAFILCAKLWWFLPTSLATPCEAFRTVLDSFWGSQNFIFFSHIDYTFQGTTAKLFQGTTEGQKMKISDLREIMNRFDWFQRVNTVPIHNILSSYPWNITSFTHFQISSICSRFPSSRISHFRVMKNYLS